MSLLHLKKISKSFGSVQALDEVELEVEKGEVLGLIGENGAGKSTLMNILGGMFPPSAGQILLDGSSVTIHDAKTAEHLRISFVHQELNLLDNIDIAGNIFLGREPMRFGCIDQKRLHDLSRPLLETLGLSIDPSTSVALLSNGQKQLVEIAKALSMDAKILILDEPTSSLTLQETDTLLTLAQKLRQQGMAIIFISHRLAEIEAIADRVIALRDGRNAGWLGGEEINRNAMISMMIGRELDEVYPKTKPPVENVVLSVKDFSTRRWPNGRATFEIKSGEILGLAGLVGAGRSELAQALFGVDDSPGGLVEIESQSIPRGDVGRCVGNRIFLAPEDRKSSGLVLEMSIRENMTLNSMKRFTRYLCIDFASEKEKTEVWLRDFGIKAPSSEQVVGNLSGGNQQKVVLAKWMTLKPKVMIFDEPTRGIDMGAREEIYNAIAKLAETDCAILMISSDMEELLGMSHRIAVMREGGIAGILDKDAFSEEAIMQLAVREDLATSA